MKNNNFEMAAVKLTSNFFKEANHEYLSKNQFKDKDIIQAYKEIYSQFYELIRNENAKVDKKQRQETLKNK